MLKWPAESVYGRASESKNSLIDMRRWIYATSLRTRRLFPIRFIRGPSAGRFPSIGNIQARKMPLIYILCLSHSFISVILFRALTQPALSPIVTMSQSTL